ncbi:MAG: WecB/TagA/CpsF family glycosyltransferase [Clostridia bacterium]|nr:WecB/TagA/CpsF family glycosyltransferase [Clostridia bacterium]
MKTNIFGVLFDNFTISETVEKAVSFENAPFVLYTPNPEIVQIAKKEPEFCEVLNTANVVTPDGIGIVYASKILGGHIKERAAGFDICCGILEKLAQKGGSVYLFGGKPGVAEQAKAKVEESYKGITVCGVADGYFDAEKEKQIVADISEKAPDLLLVCLGAPKQEKWIAQNKDILNAKILVGAGGTIDVLSGNTKRAPEIFIKLGLEWFYRLLCEPKRIGRMMQLPLFLLEVVFKRGKLRK